MRHGQADASVVAPVKDRSFDTVLPNALTGTLQTRCFVTGRASTSPFAHYGAAEQEGFFGKRENAV